MTYNAEEWLSLADQVARKMTRTADEKEELFAALSLWLVEKGPAVYAKAPGAGALMHRALRDHATDVRRYEELRQHEPFPADDAPGAVVPDNDVADLYEREQRRRAVREAVQRHSPEAALIFRTVFEEEKSHRSAALALRIPYTTYMDRWARIREDLADTLKEWA